MGLATITGIPARTEQLTAQQLSRYTLLSRHSYSRIFLQDLSSFPYIQLLPVAHPYSGGATRPVRGVPKRHLGLVAKDAPTRTASKSFCRLRCYKEVQLCKTQGRPGTRWKNLLHLHTYRLRLLARRIGLLRFIPGFENGYPRILRLQVLDGCCKAGDSN